MATEQLQREGASLEAAAAIERAVRESLPEGGKGDVVEGIVKEVLAALAGAEYVAKPIQEHLTVRIASGRITGPTVCYCGGKPGCGARAPRTFEGDAPGPGPTEGRAFALHRECDLLDSNFYTLKTIVLPPFLPFENRSLTFVTYCINNDPKRTPTKTGLWVGTFTPPLPSEETFSGPGRFT